MPKQPDHTAELAADVWRRIFDFIVATGPERIDILARYGLTPNDSRALNALGEDATGKTMRTLAADLDCDASTVTWIVDRLEAKGLAERRGHPTDRRVKHVVLTPKGIETKAAVKVATYTPPAALLELPVEDLAILQRASTLLPEPGRPAASARGGTSEDAPRRTTRARRRSTLST
jgi:DNA-binding MarR family transcriptional regulator